MFYIDPSIGASINASMTGQTPPRPLTHDLFLLALEGFGAGVSRMVITKVEDDFVKLKLADNVEIRLQKSAIGATLPKGTLKQLDSE